MDIHDVQEEPDFAKILDASHNNTWVAIAPDRSRVLAAAKSLGELMQLISDPDAIFYRVLPRGTFAPADR